MMDNDHDNDNDHDDNEKQSKINRQSRGFLRNAVIFVAGLTVFGLVLGYVHTQAPPQLAKDIHQHLMETHNLQQHPSSSSRSSNTRDDPPPPQSIPQTQQEPEEQEPEEQEPEELVELYDELVRARKSTKGVIMETDPEGLQLTQNLQTETFKLLEHRYGYETMRERFRVRVDLLLPQSILSGEADESAAHAHFVIELAPPILIPCSVFYFLELARTYQGGKFHRNANHVLQANAQSGATKGHKSMPFQEYNPEFPHAKYTTGYAGRPSGPEWYVSIQDNSRNHGPGSQQDHNPHEADSNFGSILEGAGYEQGVIAKIHSVPQKGWLDKENSVEIVQLTILVPSGGYDEESSSSSEWVEWKPTL